MTKMEKIIDYICNQGFVFCGDVIGNALFKGHPVLHYQRETGRQDLFRATQLQTIQIAASVLDGHEFIETAYSKNIPKQIREYLNSIMTEMDSSPTPAL